MPSNGLLSKVSQVLGLYVIYVFLSGWTSLDYYFRFFGVNPRWLDISFYDTLVKGFTVLFTGGALLSLVYILVAVLTLLAEGMPPQGRKWFCLKVVIAMLLLLMVLPVYWISREAGIAQARIDKGHQSHLPSITFTLKGSRDYHGKLLMLKGSTYFIYKATQIGEEAEPEDLSVSIYRADELQDVRVAGYE